jgi:hypothetical protein
VTERHDCPACGAGLISEPIGAPLRCKRCGWYLITRAEWEKLTPLQQGFTLYMQSDWPTSELYGLKNPYALGTTKWEAFCQGEQRAARSAQDDEE